MRVLNVHQRSLRVSPQQASYLLDGLSSERDALWPLESWPRMRFDRPLQPGASGGHGPIRYTITDYQPGERVEFQFTSPRGFLGKHWFEVLPHGQAGTLLRHTIDMELSGWARLSWPLVFRPLHDALVEDALAKAQAALEEPPARVPWSGRARMLRKAIRRYGKLPR